MGTVPDDGSDGKTMSFDTSIFGQTEGVKVDKPQYYHAQFYNDLKQCVACTCRAEATQVVSGDGPQDAKILFLGRNPGRDEDKRGLPFVGRGGNELERMLHELGLSRQAVGILNVVKCHTTEDRPPKPIEITACTTLWLPKELDLFQQAEIIFPLGVEATRVLLGSGAESTGRREGYWVKIQADGGRTFAVCPLNHPGYILRSPRHATQMYNATLPAVKRHLMTFHKEAYERSREP